MKNLSQSVRCRSVPTIEPEASKIRSKFANQSTAVLRAHKNGQTQAISNQQKPVRTHIVIFVTNKYSATSGTQDDSSVMLFRTLKQNHRQLAQHQLLLMGSCLSCEEKRCTVATQTYKWIDISQTSSASTYRPNRR
jgi:hypothetical protein